MEGKVLDSIRDGKNLNIRWQTLKITGGVLSQMFKQRHNPDQCEAQDQPQDP